MMDLMELFRSKTVAVRFALVFALFAVPTLLGFIFADHFLRQHVCALTEFIRPHSVASNLMLGAIVMLSVVLCRTAWVLLQLGNASEDGPPQLAELLVCVFARAKDIDALMGDLQELFEGDVAGGMSRRRARTRYWGRVLRSLLPLMWQFIKRVGLLGLFVGYLRR